MRIIVGLVLLVVLCLSYQVLSTSVQEKLAAIEALQEQLQDERAMLVASLQSQEISEEASLSEEIPLSEETPLSDDVTSIVSILTPALDRCINADNTIVYSDAGSATTERLRNNTPVKLWARSDNSRFKIGNNRWVSGANLKMKCETTPTPTPGAGRCAAGSSSCILNVPFMSQHSNPYGQGDAGPSNTCQLTAACMVVNYRKAGACRPSAWYALRQDVKSNSGAANLIKRLLGHGWYTSRGTREQIKTAIRAGYPLYVNTYLTSGGHVVLINGFDSRGFYFNDPWGQYNNGYVNYNAAKSWLIPYSQLGSGILGAEGDIWLATGDTSPVNLSFGTRV